MVQYQQRIGADPMDTEAVRLIAESVNYLGSAVIIAALISGILRQ